MAAMNRRLRQWGRYVPRETGQRTATTDSLPAWCVEGKGNAIIVRPPSREPESFMAAHDDPLLMDTTLDPKPRRGGRHRRQR